LGLAGINDIERWPGKTYITMSSEKGKSASDKEMPKPIPWKGTLTTFLANAPVEEAPPVQQESGRWSLPFKGVNGELVGFSHDLYNHMHDQRRPFPTAFALRSKCAEYTCCSIC
jgi:hypothetical protein